LAYFLVDSFKERDRLAFTPTLKIAQQIGIFWVEQLRDLLDAMSRAIRINFFFRECLINFVYFGNNICSVDSEVIFTGHESVGKYSFLHEVFLILRVILSKLP